MDTRGFTRVASRSHIDRAEMTVNMLRAQGVDAVLVPQTRPPAEARMGFQFTGYDIYVPDASAEDARALLGSATAPGRTRSRP